MDPLGNVPFFSVMIAKIKKERRVRVLVRELLASFLLILFFFFLGKKMLSLLNLQQEALNIAGGIILFLISLEMIFGKKANVKNTEIEEEPFIVPLATPMIAGPSLFATIVIFSNTYSDHFWPLLLAITIAWIINSLFLMFSPFAERLFKKKGLAVLEKLMGMILITLAVQMLLNGIKSFLL